jgi:hypothetical protein
VFKVKNGHPFVRLLRMPLMSGTSQIVDEDVEPQLRRIAACATVDKLINFPDPSSRCSRSNTPDALEGGER